MNRPTTSSMTRPLTALTLAASLAALPGCLGFRFDRTGSSSGGGPDRGATTGADAADTEAATDAADPEAAARESRASAATAALASRGGAHTAAAAGSTAACGGGDQRACFVWERIPSCNAGLVENLMAQRCLPRSRDGALESSARKVKRDLTELLETLGGYVTCFDAKVLERAIRKGDAAYARSLADAPCVKRMGAIAAERGYRTLTVGLSGGGSFVLGAFVDTGFAFDTSGKRAPTLYQTKAISIGLQAGAGVGLNIGLSKSSSAPLPEGSGSHGFSFEAGAGVGMGTAIWYTYEGQLDGVSVSAIAGADGKAGAYNRVSTSFYDLAGQNPVSCGAAGKRPCSVTERIPSCDAGLAEDLRAHVCRPPAAFACGGENGAPCKLWERVPSCNAGLHEDFFAGQCKR